MVFKDINFSIYVYKYIVSLEPGEIVIREEDVKAMIEKAYQKVTLKCFFFILILNCTVCSTWNP